MVGHLELTIVVDKFENLPNLNFSHKGVYSCFAEIGQNRDFGMAITIRVYMLNIYRPLRMTAMAGPDPLEGFRGQMNHLMGSYGQTKIDLFATSEN